MSRGLKGSPGFMTPEMRAAWRDRHCDLPALVEAASNEADAGRLSNAWVGYHLVLDTWLATRATGRPTRGVPMGDKTQIYAWRLVKRGVFEPWTAKMVERFLLRPKVIERFHVDLLASFVVALTLERGRDYVGALEVAS